MISVLLVDDHPVVIEGLRKVLATTPDISVTGEAHDASTALERAKSLKPDVILLDLRMPGASGIQTVRRLREHGSTPAVIILTSYGDQAYVRQALEAGADGYLLKSTPPEQLIAAIRAASRGRRQLSPELIDGLIEEFGGLAREQTSRVADLSPDDLEILRLASKGATNREIGVATGRTEVAIKKRLQIIFDKLDAVDRAHAVAEAIRRGLI
ncbi:MAG: response regulator [Thermomicrobiales bacterium]